MGFDIFACIKEVGFPIAAFLLIWYQNNTTLKNLKVAIDELKDALLNFNK